MFDIGPAELLVIFVVALLVIGPERLPMAVKTASLWLGRFRRSFHKIKSEVERELNADEIRRQLHNESILAEVEDAKKQANEFAGDIKKTASLDSDEQSGDKPSPTGSDGADTGSTSVSSKSSESDSSSATKETPPQGERSASTDAQPADSSVKGEVKQAISYVNDISREVSASKEEIEKKLRDPLGLDKPSSDDKS